MSPIASMSYSDAFVPSILIAALGVAILPWFDRNNTVVRFCALAVCIILSWRYMFWRIFDTVPPIDEPVNFIIGLIFTAVEALNGGYDTYRIFSDSRPQSNG